MSSPSNGAAKNLGDSTKQALHALISSLAPDDSSEGSKLSEEKVHALSERLNQILGNGDDDPKVRRNEKGELLNEEGLPVVDIEEPLTDTTGPSHSSEAVLPEQDPPPLTALTEQEKLQLRIQRDRILDMLEEEERLESKKDLEGERIRQLKEVAKMDAESKAAAREMQKKMGKALLQNLAAQREKEEEKKKKAQPVSSQDDDASHRRPKKSVSFANVPEVDESKPKPKPPVVWGEVSVAKLKAGVPKARLKAEALANQPLKLEVVERIPGAERPAPQEGDSDDESNPEERGLEMDENGENESTRSLRPDYEESENLTGHDEDSEEDEFDFSQASLQREVALEYIRLRESIGAEAHQAMTSHTHEGEDEWDQPNVPLDATRSSKPSNSGVSRFKAERQANTAATSNASTSLGASVLPQGESSTLRKAVRAGKLQNGGLVGGEAGESDSGDDEVENIKRTMEMLKDGVVVPDASPAPVHISAKINHHSTMTTERDSSIMPPSPARAANLAVGKTSRFKAERAAQRSSVEPAPGSSPPVASSSSPVLLSDTVLERPSSGRPLQLASVDSRRTTPPNTAFKKQPSVIPVPSIPPSQRRPFAKPSVAPDPAFLSNMIVESPSFPPPCTKVRTQSGSQPFPLVSEVRESSRKAGISEEPSPRAGKISRFMAERL